MTALRSAPRALVYVQHLLGLGHLMRISRIAAALQQAGVETTVMQGGTATPLVSMAQHAVIQLPPVKVDLSNMSQLLHENGSVFSETNKAQRKQILLDTLAHVQPDILLIEAFPFGRRQMRFELLPLLDAARRMHVAVIASSIRDILQVNRKPGRAEETVDLITSCFDLVLVHGEEAITPLSRTFPLAHQIRHKVVYTGMVGPIPVARFTGMHAPDKPGVIVSAGGGAVGYALLTAALGAYPLAARDAERWLVLTGPQLPAPQYEALVAQAVSLSPHIDIRRDVPDLASHLSGARLSISQAGYNTVADILATGCRSVLVPFAGGEESEQSERARLLAAAHRAVVLEECCLSAENIASAMADAMAAPDIMQTPDLNGAQKSAEILLEHLHRSNPMPDHSGRYAKPPAVTSEASL